MSGVTTLNFKLCWFQGFLNFCWTRK